MAQVFLERDSDQILPLWSPYTADNSTVSTARIWVVPATGLVATLFWDSLLILPAKLLTVLIHELGHAIAAMLAGARVEGIAISLTETGETIVTQLHSLPGFVAAVSAGYLGSALVGSVLLNRGMVGRYSRLTLLAFSAILVYSSLLFSRGGDTAFLVGLGWGLALLLPVGLGRGASQLSLLVVGTLLLWYCFFDLFDFAGPSGRTDADILADFLVREQLVAPAARSTAALATAIAWAGCMALVLIGFLRGPVYSARSEELASPAPDVGSAEDDPANPFPGDVTPEVELWLMERGLAADGRPLIPEEGMELPAGAQAADLALPGNAPLLRGSPDGQIS